MEQPQITKDSEKLITVMYKQYLENRKSGMAKSRAACLGSSHTIHESLLPKWSFKDVDDTCRELNRAGLVSCIWADNIAFRVSISDSGIIYMENRFKNGLAEVIDFIAKFIP